MPNTGTQAPDVFDPELVSPEVEFIVDIEWVDHMGDENRATFEVRQNDIREALAAGIDRLYAKFKHMVAKVIGCRISGE